MRCLHGASLHPPVREESRGEVPEVYEVSEVSEVFEAPEYMVSDAPNGSSKER